VTGKGLEGLQLVKISLRLGIDFLFAVYPILRAEAGMSLDLCTLYSTPYVLRRKGYVG